MGEWLKWNWNIMAMTTDQMREYMRSYRAKRRTKAKTSLGGCCSKCGATINLEFDHIDRTNKVDGIANLITNSKETLNTELAKCQLLCKKCHYAKSIAVGDLPVAQHGGSRMYNKGCRCNLCIEYKRNYNKTYYKRNRKKFYYKK